MSGVKLTRSVGRPSATGKALENWLMDFANWLHDWQESSGHWTNAPNSSLKSYEVIIGKNPDSGEFVAAEWLKYAVFGRKSGKYPPATRVGTRLRWLQLEQWIRDSPKMQISDEATIINVAFLIARKISEQGTGLPKLRPQNIDLVLDNFSKKHLNILGDELADEVADGLAKRFKR